MWKYDGFDVLCLNCQLQQPILSIDPVNATEAIALHAPARSIVQASSLLRDQLCLLKKLSSILRPFGVGWEP